MMVQLESNWPDFVFQQDYYLTPLDQLESEIARLGHLPGIPSAAEVQSNGLVIGEMQALLLEKIEELTLHMINLKKENLELKEQITEMKNQIITR